jgi:hypothetical protein
MSRSCGLPGGGSGGAAQEVVLLDVGAVRRRAACSMLAAQGGLTAGTAQWLGLVVVPLADTLHRAQLQLSAFGPAGDPSPHMHWWLHPDAPSNAVTCTRAAHHSVSKMLLCY